MDRLPYALNTHLPVDIVVTKAFEVHDGFNAIGSCSRKEYTYTIYNSRVRDPFYVNRAWFYPAPLDEKIMQAAAQQAKRMISNAIASGSHRPEESGTAAQAPSVSRFDYRRATPEQRKALKEAIYRAAAEGRKIYPG